MMEARERQDRGSMGRHWNYSLWKLRERLRTIIPSDASRASNGQYDASHQDVIDESAAEVVYTAAS